LYEIISVLRQSAIVLDFDVLELIELLIKQYEGKEPIFDIAKIQSTYPDGNRCTFSKFGERYYSMVPGYFSDGGHLNETSRKKVAEQFLILLAKLN
jgi:hypothetical protein